MIIYINQDEIRDGYSTRRKYTESQHHTVVRRSICHRRQESLLEPFVPHTSNIMMENCVISHFLKGISEIEQSKTP